MLASKRVISKLKTLVESTVHSVTDWDRAGSHALTLWPHLISVHEKTGNVSHLGALKDGRRWQQHGNSPNSCGIASHFDDVSRVSCYSETLKGRLCFSLSLSLSLCLSFPLSLFLCLCEGFLWESAVLAQTLIPPPTGKNPTTTPYSMF